MRAVPVSVTGAPKKPSREGNEKHTETSGSKLPRPEILWLGAAAENKVRGAQGWPTG